MLSVSLFACLWYFPEQLHDGMPWLVGLDLGLGAVGYVLVQFRRRWPLAVAMITNLLGAFSASITGPSVLATVSLACRRRWWEYVPVGLTVAASVTVFYLIQPRERVDPWWMLLLLAIAAATTEIGWGLYIGSRRQLIWTLWERAQRAERERDLEIERARARERSTVAREAHDVVAHRISQLSMHAGALAFRDDLGPEVLRANV